MFNPTNTSDRMKVSNQVLALDLEALLPKVTITDNHATLEYPIGMIGVDLSR